MLAAVIVLAVLLVLALAGWLMTRRLLANERLATTTQTARADDLTRQLTARRAELDGSKRDHEAQRLRAETAERRADAAEGRAGTAEQQAAEATARAMRAEETAAATAAERDTAQRAAAEATQVSQRADDLVAAAERTAGGGLDPSVLWSLERARTERLWRENVALGPDAGAAFDTADSPVDELRRALHVEVETQREVVGAIVEPHIELGHPLTPSGPLLVLRATQELLAQVAHSAERTDLRIREDGADVVVTVEPVDADDQPIAVADLGLPITPGLEPVPGGVRIKQAVVTDS